MIGEAHLKCAIDNTEYSTALTERTLNEGEFITGEEIAEFGDEVIRRLELWWNELADKSCTRMIKTYFGPISLHQLLERSTWHPAQHARQIMAVLERFGIEPVGRLTSQDLAGLPLPERLWE